MFIGFTKMNGLGNDFIVIDNFNGKIIFTKEQIALLCERHKGIGADGLILVESKKDVHAFMNYYNSDGSEAEMCGNGIRCVASFLKNFYFKNEKKFKIGTRAGIKEITCEEDGTFSVNMSKPVFEHSDFPKEGIKINGLMLNFVSIGNPHAVLFVDDLKNFDLLNIGPKIEKNYIFPNKINFEVVREKNKKEFEVRVWERGCGETLSCGTGACAVYALSRKLKNADKEIVVKLLGGKLFLSENEKGEIIMRGEAQSVFSGMIEIDYVK